MQFVLIMLTFISNMNYIQKVSDECKLRGFTYQTTKTYSFWISKYINFLDKNRLNMDNESVKCYLLSLNSSINTSRIVYASIAFFFKTILNKPFTINEVPIKKKQKSLPKVLSKNEIMQMIENTKNIKHKLVIQLLYSSGLRLSELINLKKEDIDLQRNLINVKRGKGMKDRITLLSNNLDLSLTKGWFCEKEILFDELFV